MDADIDRFFGDAGRAKELFAEVRRHVEALGEADIRVSKSQIAFRHHRSFALVWMPGRYLRSKAAPLVLSVALPERDPSPRWKEVVEPKPGHFMHHLELNDVDDIDDDVDTWLRQARNHAG